ncbi:hypothetical protein BJY00DRAFT_321785 [Aspergillus carlsbadensis]|nr:hypothetical protein BJY00DRAFT_321785 [Aspergillus carlsbadensis]
MSPTAIPTQTPCRNCRGDKRQPVCKRCEIKGLACSPVPMTRFSHHRSSARLEAGSSTSQIWVNYVEAGLGNKPSIDASSPRGPDPGEMANTNLYDTFDQGHIDTTHQAHGESPGTTQALNLSSPVSLPTSFHSAQYNADALDQLNLAQTYCSQDPTRTRVEATDHHHHHHTAPSSAEAITAVDPIQESCLLRYFIEELSAWFDHCDEQRHFQLVVPRRAAHCATLRNAIFAASSRRLYRLPQYRTPRGIVFGGQLLPNLKESSALEYMLKCIPDLIEFPKIQDPVEQENIMAATVILRQYEEIEEDVDHDHDADDEAGGNMINGATETRHHSFERVNFLAITQTIIDAMSTAPMRSSLARACYWITIRQETYYALTRETVPHLRFDSDRWPNASIADDMILFAGQVATWRWTGKSSEQWWRLKAQEQLLLHGSLEELKPLLDLKAKKSKGEVFPTIWYSFDVQVTAIQHFRLAQLILTAENPQLENATRATHRRVEAEVRSIVLELCGIALCHRQIQPALVNAVIAITLYGEYFTDQEDRDALIGIISMTSDIRAWSMRTSYERLKEQWAMVDSAEI